MDKQYDAAEEYFQNIIRKSWTWQRLTEEEKAKFLSMDVFGKIKGCKKQRIEWINSVYTAFLYGLGYKPIGWRETEKDVPQF